MQLAAVVIAVVLCALRRWADAVIVVVAVAGSSRINVTLKPIIERARPDLWEPMTVETTYSFPSDVLAGWCLTVLWVSAVVMVVRYLARIASKIKTE